MSPLGWGGRLRPPLLTSGLLAGLAVYALLFFVTTLSWRLCFITAWNVGASFALMALFLWLRQSPPGAMKRNALRQDTGKWVVLVLALVAATASLVVIAA